ncbi:2Fe-2S iron-sulfur cluster-binding protein [Azovibrio restrictus]|uniref:2Fe-2S iron-sulfur cluster-binding protein n=1 Tax=Azovibrio restrictus TaxID=146938 RepID=UPI00042A0B3A|nr:2Fe-2S iron-sulfur cluster-binding protein [Azovibrio restrictus]MDD3483835.1 2Fe-2S iron-sulfur cluster-binding protein [Azovibrio restrictus]
MRYSVQIEETGEVYACTEQQSLLWGLAQLGRKGIPLGCRGGGCGVCKVAITQGDYQTGPMSAAHVTPEERQSGVVLACRCYPRGDLSLRVLGKMQRTVCAPGGGDAAKASEQHQPAVQ